MPIKTYIEMSYLFPKSVANVALLISKKGLKFFHNNAYIDFYFLLVYLVFVERESHKTNLAKNVKWKKRGLWISHKFKLNINI
jgi:hypothetical protein